LYGYQPTVEPNTTLLDYYTGAAAAYSLRSLSTSTTNVVKVRRSGDDAELDFTASQVSDGALAAWVVAGGGTEDGFVTTWYDQSGNANNATQATAANQPKIVSSGSLVTENGKAAIDFDGVDDSFALSNANLAISDYQISSVAYGANILGPIYCQGDNDGWSTRALIMRPSFGIIASSSLSDTLTVDYTSSSQILITYEHKSNTSNGEKVYVDGSFVTQVNSVGDVRNSTTAAIGHDYTSQYIDGTIQEIIIYNFDQSSNRTGIEANINDYYNIYP
jgi:hypothetical protein